MDFLSSNPRPAQLMVSKDQPVLVTLEKTLSKHLTNEVKMVSIKADKREPEFVFYDGLKFTMYAYNVKPAVFDLFLAAAIAGYLGIIYLAVQVSKHETKTKKTTQTGKLIELSRVSCLSGGAAEHRF